MRKVILSAAISFDGFIEGAKGETDWIIFGEGEGASDLMGLVAEIDTSCMAVLVMKCGGIEKSLKRVRTSKRTSTARSRKWTDMFSRQPIPNLRAVSQSSGIMPASSKDLKSKPGKNIWLYGGSSLVTTFTNLRPGKTAVRQLKESKPSPSGAIGVRYEVVR